MFRSSTIIRKITLNLAKVIFMLIRSVKLRRYLLWGCVAACHEMTCVLYALQNVQHTTHTPFHDMLPHNHIINNYVISSNF